MKIISGWMGAEGADKQLADLERFFLYSTVEQFIKEARQQQGEPVLVTILVKEYRQEVAA